MHGVECNYVHRNVNKNIFRFIPLQHPNDEPNNLLFIVNYLLWYRYCRINLLPRNKISRSPIEIFPYPLKLIMIRFHNLFFIHNVVFFSQFAPISIITLMSGLNKRPCKMIQWFLGKLGPAMFSDKLNVLNDSHYCKGVWMYVLIMYL